jgi:peptidoglycan/LPS O-acetylase OafA/YrhL
MRLPFRADIDYLRAIAVLSVIGFHYDIAGFSGGFVGVDIFFVISGHLITRLLWTDIQAQRFSFWDFYERRARRLLPALYVMILFTGIAAWFLAPPDDYTTFFGSAVSTLLFSSNIFFWLQTGYFDLPSVGKVLIHTWSLSVEEQFYFMFPLLTWLWSKCFRDPTARPSMALLVAGTVALCVADELLLKGSASAAFYLAPLRAWEFLLGGLSLFLLRWSPTDFSVRCGFALAGAALMVGPVILFTAQTRFPGFQALIPCLGATLFIIAFNRDGRKPPLPAEGTGLFLGKISYSLYLWHWPVFVLGTAAMPLAWAGAPPVTASLLLCSLGLAYASYLLVEAPPRGRLQWRGVRVSGLIAGTAAILLAVCAFGVAENGYPNRFAKSEQRMLLYNIQAVESVYRLHTCFLQPSEPISLYKSAECLAFASDKLNILLVGDSTAAHYVSALRQSLNPERYNLLQLNAANCAPFIGFHQPRSENCDQVNAMFRDLLKERRISAVILSGNWRVYADLYRTPLPSIAAGRAEALTSEFDANLGATLSATEDADMPTLLLGPSLEFPLPLAQTLARHERNHLPTGSALKPVPAAFSTDEHVRRLSQLYRNVRFVSVLDAICSHQDCPLKLDADTPIVWDTLHLTPEGAVYVVKRLWPALDMFLGQLSKRQDLVVRQPPFHGASLPPSTTADGGAH